jgi:hypothetical protein
MSRPRIWEDDIWGRALTTLCDTCVRARREMEMKRVRDGDDFPDVSRLLSEILFGLKKAELSIPGLGLELDPLLSRCWRAGWHHPGSELALEYALVFAEVEDSLCQLAGRKKPPKPELDRLPGYPEYRARRSRKG